jgi:hypothetical protein
MKSLSMAFGFIGIIAAAVAQDAPKNQRMPPAMESAVRHALSPYGKSSQQFWLRPNSAPPPTVEAFADKCAVPLLNVPIPKDVEFTMLIKKVPKDIDSHIIVPPPIPACPDR